MTELINNPENWVVVAFLIFVGFTIYLGAPKAITQALDDRSKKIRDELDEARRLRQEAQSLLADYQKKARDAEDEAKAIIDQARREAEALAFETKKGLAESLDRRAKLAQDKIARAETQALAQVRSSAVDAAVAAAEHILRNKTSGTAGADLIDQSIKDLKSRLN